MPRFEILYDGPYDEDAISQALAGQRLEYWRVYRMTYRFDPDVDLSDFYFYALDQVMSNLRKNVPGVIIYDVEVDSSTNSVTFYFADSLQAALPFIVDIVKWVSLVIISYLAYKALTSKAIQRLTLATAKMVGGLAEYPQWLLLIIAAMILLAFIMLLKR